MRVDVRAKEEQIKRILSRELPFGCRQVIADILDTRPERISRELSYEDVPKAKLSHSVLTVALEILRMEGKSAAADEIVSIRDAGQPHSIAIDVHRITMRRDADGSVHWEIEK